MTARLRRRVLDVYAFLALAYLFLPIAIVVLFSFNNPAGRFNFTWEGFTFKNWAQPFGYPGLGSAVWVSRPVKPACARSKSGVGLVVDW